jgi:hypothetical protein
MRLLSGAAMKEYGKPSYPLEMMRDFKALR